MDEYSIKCDGEEIDVWKNEKKLLNVSICRDREYEYVVTDETLPTNPENHILALTESNRMEPIFRELGYAIFGRYFDDEDLNKYIDEQIQILDE